MKTLAELHLEVHAPVRRDPYCKYCVDNRLSSVIDELAKIENRLFDVEIKRK